MTRADFLDMTAFNITCPHCGQHAVYQVKSNLDYAVCHHCNTKFDLTADQLLSNKLMLDFINTIPDR